MVPAIICRVTWAPLKGGFINVPSEWASIFPRTKPKSIVKVMFGESEVPHNLTYYREWNRLSGLRQFYRDNDVKREDLVRIEKSGKWSYRLSLTRSSFVMPLTALPSVSRRSRVERDLYKHVCNALKKTIGRKDPVVEVTAYGGRPPERLESLMEHSSVVLMTEKQFAPDLTGCVIEQESPFGFKILRDPVPNLIVVEVKNKGVNVGDFYQAKRYGEVFKAKYTFLISTRPLGRRSLEVPFSKTRSYQV